ncbi:MAG: hypothetical protein N3D73_00665 [Candidatus Diapherotrites archaeon]|nr:hypothetical protein [Candidatus Diapherotrites archaeon]
MGFYIIYYNMVENLSKNNLISKVPTGIKGLDDALNGGIPKGNIVLLSGGCGTGKSTFCLQYLVNGAKIYNERGLYISTEQSKPEILRAGMQFGWDLENLEKKNLLKIVYFDIVEGDDFLEKVHDNVAQFAPQRIVIDSLTTFTDSILVSDDSEKKPYTFAKVVTSVSPIPKSERIIARAMLYHLIRKLRLFNATVIMTSELPEKTDFLSADEISEFICDGVINTYFLGIEGANSLTLRIRKMRYTDHNKSYIPYSIVSNKGIEVDLANAMDVLMK